MHVLRKPDLFDYLAFAWNLTCCLFLSALALVPIGFAAFLIYVVIGCRIVDLFR